MRVLADFHHSDLWESLEMLFTDRFGWDLFRPIGMEWFDSGIWQFERAPSGRAGWVGDEVAKQYLTPYSTDRQLADWSERDDDTHPGRVYRMVTMEQARALNLDIVIATLTENEEGWHGFAREIGAKFGLQLGNEATVNRYDLADFCLFSTTREHLPWVPYVFYHHEFSLEDFRFEYPPTEPDVAATWVQCLPSGTVEWERFKLLAAATPEIQWYHHGHCNQDSGYWRSNVKTTREVAAQMRAARIGIHFKTWSDGYGHVIHNLFAVGKPVLATALYYRGKMAEPLMVEGVTCWDVETKSKEEVVALLRRLHEDDDFHRQVSEASYARFREVVNFDADAEAVREMFSRVL